MVESNPTPKLKVFNSFTKEKVSPKSFILLGRVQPS